MLMNEYMQLLLNMSYQTAIIVGIILIVRQIFKGLKLPGILNYCLWIIPFMRMILPWTLESRYSLLPIQWINQGFMQIVNSFIQKETPIAEQGISYIQIVASPQTAGTVINMEHNTVVQRSIQETQGWQEPTGISSIAFIWMVGILVFLSYSIISYLRLKKKLDCCICLREKIYLADYIDTPFVLGIISPKIYLPSEMDEHEMNYVIAHEEVHIKRGDYLVKIVAYCITCIHWFNPLAWVAFWFLGKDMEISCDEHVIRNLDQKCRGEYAETLLRLTTGKRNRYGVPLAFGEGNTKGRIRNIMKYKKPLMIVMIFAVLFMVVLAVGLLIVPKEQHSQKEAPEFYTESEEGTSQNESTEMKGTQIDFAATPVNLESDMIIGADGTSLDYAGQSYIIFHDYYGLFIYSLEVHQMLVSINLEPINCQYTQGDNPCFVTVSKDGSKILLENMNTQYLYDVAKGEMWIPEEEVSIDEPVEKQSTSQFIITEAVGFRSEACFPVTGNIYGYLESPTGLVKDLCYIYGQTVIPLFSKYWDYSNEMNVWLDSMNGERTMEEEWDKDDSILNSSIYALEINDANSWL